MHISGAATTVVLAASVGLQVPTTDSPAAALARAEARWRAHRPTAYTFGIVLTCECFPKGATFRVIDGRVQAPHGANGGAQRLHDRYGTVEKLFTVVRDALAAGGHRILVKYDAELGYPIGADLDPSRDIIDDELFLRVTGFRKLETPARRGLPNTPLQPTTGGKVGVE